MAVVQALDAPPQIKKLSQFDVIQITFTKFVNMLKNSQMKYTKKQAKFLKEKGMNRFSTSKRLLPDVKIINGFYVIESKINK